MKLLAIDSSGRRGSLALAEFDVDRPHVCVEAALPASPRTAQTLLPTLRQLLADAGWAPAEVECVAVTAGPGSFTGLRIGVTTAKTFAYATGAKLVAVPTLAALAVGCDASRRPVWAVLDAQREEVFAARFVTDPQGGDPEPQCLVLPLDEWLARLRPGEAVATPALKKLAPSLPAGIETIPGVDDGPSAAAVATLGAAIFACGRTVDPLQLVPQYHRRSAAEEKALK